MELSADFGHEKGQDDLIDLQNALGSLRRVHDQWTQKPFQASMLTGRKIILSDETMGAISDLEIATARCDTEIGLSPHCTTMARLMSRMEGVCAAIANGFPADYRVCCYLDYFTAKAKASPEAIGTLVAQATGASLPVIQASLCGRQIEAIVARLLNEECAIASMTPERIVSLNDALCRAINPTWELGMRTWDYRAPEDGRAMAYQPPAASDLRRYLEDISTFVTDSKLSPVAKAALVFFQLDAVRMFPHHFDQLGRIISFYMWKHTDLVRHVIPPISATPAIHPKKHQEKLKPYLYQGETTDMLLLDDWIYHVARSTQNAVELELASYRELCALLRGWHQALQRTGVRPSATLSSLLETLVANPVFSITSLSEDAEIAFSTTGRFVESLEAAGIVSQVTDRRRNRLYECPEALAFFGKMIPELT